MKIEKNQEISDTLNKMPFVFGTALGTIPEDETKAKELTDEFLGLLDHASNILRDDRNIKLLGQLGKDFKINKKGDK